MIAEPPFLPGASQRTRRMAPESASGRTRGGAGVPSLSATSVTSIVTVIEPLALLGSIAVTRTK